MLARTPAWLTTAPRSIGYVIVAGLIAGCGDGADSPSSTANQPTSVATSGEETALKYVRSLSTSDYRSACGLLAEDLRKQFEAVDGSCELGLDNEGAVGDSVEFTDPTVEVLGDTSADRLKVRIDDSDGDSAELLLQQEAGGTWRVIRSLKRIIQ